MFTGFAGVYAATYNAGSDYTDGFKVGEGISVSISANYAEGSLYGDNYRVKYKSKFKSATVTLNVTTLPAVANSVMFGHTANDDGGYTSKGTDETNYVGLGCYATEETEDEIYYTAVWLYKVKFSDPGHEFETEGENITFKTPSITGSAEAVSGAEWKETAQFDTEDEAIAWIQAKAGITTTE